MGSWFFFVGIIIVQPLEAYEGSAVRGGQGTRGTLAIIQAHITWTFNTHSGMLPTPIHSAGVMSPFLMQSKASVVCSAIPPVLTLGAGIPLAHGTYPPGPL